MYDDDDFIVYMYVWMYTLSLDGKVSDSLLTELKILTEEEILYEG